MQAEAYPAHQRSDMEGVRSEHAYRTDTPTSRPTWLPRGKPRGQLLGMVMGLGGRVKAATAFQLEKVSTPVAEPLVCDSCTG